LSDPAPTIHLRDAHLSFHGRLLFDRLATTIPGGRITCLLGPSGVGKSSLLRLVAGLAEGAEGEAEDDEGRPLAGRISYMAQQDLLLPWLDVLGNVVIGDRLRRQRPRRERARALLERVGLGDHAEDRPASLSGGMRQRVALARTLFEDRAAVLMDEPFSALDAITRLQLQDLAAELLRGRTVLLVTHDPLEALRLGHRILVLTGRPARLEAPIEPAGLPPREPGDAELLALHARLLERLAEAKQAS
jgi:putative hydroxymethylpyrimidine transport system ATP-binding protein